MDNINIAKGALAGEVCFAALSPSGKLVTSSERGVKFLLELSAAPGAMSGYVAADKIVGRAAAFLMIRLGITEVYAATLSRPAEELFRAYGIKYSFGNSAERIINRAGTGLCPMESAVQGINEPDAAYEALKAAFEKLGK